MPTTTNPVETIEKKIKNLPPFPLVLQKLLAVMEQPEASAEDISQVISSDQALAGKVLKLVNSSFYGLSGQVSTISRAVVILGTSPLRSLAVGMGAAKIMASTGKGAIQERFWSHAIASAASAEVMARHADFADPEETFIAGLLHDLGHLILHQAHPEAFERLVARENGLEIDLEKEHLGMAHTQAGQKLLRHWRVPANLCSAVRFHHTRQVILKDDDPLLSFTVLADMVARIHGKTYEPALPDDEFRVLFEKRGQTWQQFGDLLAAVAQRAQETRDFLRIAGDAEIPVAAAIARPSLKVVVVSTESLRAGLAREILGYFGHTVIGMKNFFGQADLQNEVDRVLLDPSSVKPEQLQKMAPLLADRPDRLRVLGKDADGRTRQALGHAPSEINLIFGNEELF